MKALLVSFTLILFLQGKAEGTFLQVKAAFHVHTNFSTGTLSPEEIVQEARREGIDAVILTDNLLLRFEYGVFPFRSLVKKVVEEPSIIQRGIGPWLQSIEAAQAHSPDVILIPGVEVVSYYYWTGSLFRGDLTMRDTQKNLLAVGLEKAEDYRNIPAIGNGSGLSFRGTHLLTLALGLILVGLGFCLMRIRREQRIRLKHFLIRLRNRHRLSGWLALGLGAVFLLETFMASRLNPYRGDLGIVPHQRVIDSVEASGGMVFWSYPESRDFHKKAFGRLGTLTIRTDPHPKALLDAHRYTGFGALYQDNVTFTEPGGEWDQLLLEYTEGRRASPAWGIGELGYHRPPKQLSDVLTVFLVGERSRNAILEAMRLGRFYSVRPIRDHRLVLEDFSIGQEGGSIWIPMGGELEASGESPLAIRIRIGERDGRAVDFSLRVIRSGRLMDVFQRKTPFSEILKMKPPDRGRADFFRIDVGKPQQLISNPVFVRR